MWPDLIGMTSVTRVLRFVITLAGLTAGLVVAQFDKVLLPKMKAVSNGCTGVFPLAEQRLTLSLSFFDTPCRKGKKIITRSSLTRLGRQSSKKELLCS